MQWNRAVSLAAVCLVWGCQDSTSRGTPRHNDDERGTFRALLTNDEPADDDAGGESGEENSANEEWSEDCEIAEDGSQSCAYDDGYGTTCEVELDAEGGLLSMSCAGDWGSYACAGDGETITCALEWEGESCSETWSAETYELIETDCAWDDYGYGYGYEESCEEDGDTLVCAYDDGYWTCETTYDASGFVIEQDCDTTDGFSYDCELTDEALVCVGAQDGEELCTDSFSFDGEPIELGCYEDYGYDYDYGDWQEECEEQEDGSLTCTWDDGECSGSYSYDAEGAYTSSSYECEGYGYDCTYGADGASTCTETHDGESCTSSWDASGCLTESDCDWATEEAFECYTYGEECTDTEDGGQVCTWGDDSCSSSTSYDAEGNYRGYTYDCGGYAIACSTRADGSSTCTETTEGESCTTEYDENGCVTSSDCDWFSEELGQFCGCF